MSAQPATPLVMCPYCEQRAIFLRSSAEVYHGRDYGPIYICRGCQAWVGVHEGTTTPLGRMANKELRDWKIAVHRVFDPVWLRRLKSKQAVDPRYTRGMARGGRYKKLGELLGIPKAECHIGMFDVETCKRAIAIIQSGALEQESETPLREAT